MLLEGGTKIECHGWLSGSPECMQQLSLKDFTKNELQLAES